VAARAVSSLRPARDVCRENGREISAKTRCASVSRKGESSSPPFGKSASRNPDRIAASSAATVGSPMRRTKRCWNSSLRPSSRAARRDDIARSRNGPGLVGWPGAATPIRTMHGHGPCAFAEPAASIRVKGQAQVLVAPPNRLPHHRNKSTQAPRIDFARKGTRTVAHARHA
jgi:hypothetical protein